MVITFQEFIDRYNEVHNTNIRYLQSDTGNIESIIDGLYENNGFEIDDENETIELW